jgi:hypothetical protein
MDWILNLWTQLRTTNNCIASANLHISQIPAANIKFPVAGSVNSRFLVAGVNNANSSASRAQVLPIRRTSHN